MTWWEEFFKKQPHVETQLRAQILDEARKELVKHKLLEARIAELQARQDATKRDLEIAKAMARDERERNYKGAVGRLQSRSYYVFAFMPADIAKDFLANLEIVCAEIWIPRYGERRTRFLWHRNCAGMVVHYWFDCLVSAAERVRKVIY